MPGDTSDSGKITLLLERVSPAVRKRLVGERVRAMRGHIEEALRALEQATDLSKNQPCDVIALGLLRAELLRLDLLEEEARDVVKKVVQPHVSILTPEERLVIDQNVSELNAFTPASARLFYNAVDQRRLLKFEWLDYRELFEARLEAERGKHFEALPILWQQHRRAYLQGCWMVQRWTNYLLALEAVQLKEWEDAAQHAIFSGDDELLDKIAESILHARNADLAQRVLNRILETANLRTHFIAACTLLLGLADAVPDAMISNVGKWLLKRACETRRPVYGLNHVRAAWKTIRPFANRFSRELAGATVTAAISHPLWSTKLDDPKRVIIEREEIVRALVPLASSLGRPKIAILAKSALELVTDRQQITDYDDVVNLLCVLAKRGGNNVRKFLADALYQKGQPVSRPLAQVAELFGKSDDFKAIRIRTVATEVAGEIRRQVEWLGPEQPSVPVAEQIMEYTSQVKDRTLKVRLVGLSGLHALARHRGKLDKGGLQTLVNAILDQVRNKDNFCVNRQSLLRALIEFADVLPPTVRKKSIVALTPLARGEVQESSEYPTAEDVANPLNPFRAHSGRPEDVQGMALSALAALAVRSRAETNRIERILEEALCDHRPSIRRAAYLASRRLPRVSDGIILGILAGLRDPDDNVAAAAFSTLAEQTGWTFSQNHWRVFLMAARFAQRTGTANLRLCAAGALATWSAKCPVRLRAECARLIADLKHDICWSVRTKVRNTCPEP